MKKSVLSAVLLLVILLAFFASAEENSTSDKAFSCLEKKVENKKCDFSLEEQAFSLLALSYKSSIQSECKSALNSKGKANECWPEDSCKIKDTSLAVLALNNIKANTDKAEDWLISKKKNPPGLEWYLEIDLTGQSDCKISYDATAKTITINEDKKISGSLGECFSLAYNNYWLKIKDSCLNKNFSVSCSKDFISAVLYKKTNSNIWHISSDTKSASAKGTTEHSINSYCLSETSACNYEANLWAALALAKKGKDVSDLLPYLSAFAEDNSKFFPDSFLYIATNSEDYLKEMLSLQKTQGYWDLGEKGKYYDTALALLALNDAEDSAASWLEVNQENDGCWGSIRDTAFLIWALYPKTPASITPGAGANDCMPAHYCISKGQCDEVNGVVLGNYDCSGLQVCCDKPAKEKICKEEGGEICSSGTDCSTDTFATSEGDCCLGKCNPETAECETLRYSCRTACLSNEEEANLACTSGKTCCKPAEEQASSYWWIYLLAILIIILIIAIIFRNKLKILIFRLKGGFKTGAVTRTQPRFPPFPPARRAFPQRPSPRPAVKARTDIELEDTLKKLREMSK